MIFSLNPFKQHLARKVPEISETVKFKLNLNNCLSWMRIIKQSLIARMLIIILIKLLQEIKEMLIAMQVI